MRWAFVSTLARPALTQCRLDAGATSVARRVAAVDEIAIREHDLVEGFLDGRVVVRPARLSRGCVRDGHETSFGVSRPCDAPVARRDRTRKPRAALPHDAARWVPSGEPSVVRKLK